MHSKLELSHELRIVKVAPTAMVVSAYFSERSLLLFKN